MKRILLARHGECDMNLHLKHRIGGQSNASPLTQLGRDQAEDLAAHLQRLQKESNTPVVGRVYSSTAVRARDTALTVLRALDQPPEALIMTDQLLELDQGEWEGADRAKTYTPEKLKEIALDPYHFRPPGGESPQDVETRVRKYIEAVVLPACDPGGPPALVVGHGFAFKTLLRSLLGADPGLTRNIHIDNTALVDIMCRPAGVPDSKGRVSDRTMWYILRVNDTTHLYLGKCKGTFSKGVETLMSTS